MSPADAYELVEAPLRLYLVTVAPHTFARPAEWRGRPWRSWARRRATK